MGSEGALTRISTVMRDLPCESPGTRALEGPCFLPKWCRRLGQMRRVMVYLPAQGVSRWTIHFWIDPLRKRRWKNLPDKSAKLRNMAIPNISCYHIRINIIFSSWGGRIAVYIALHTHIEMLSKSDRNFHFRSWTISHAIFLAIDRYEVKTASRIRRIFLYFSPDAYIHDFFWICLSYESLKMEIMRQYEWKMFQCLKYLFPARAVCHKCMLSATELPHTFPWCFSSEFDVNSHTNKKWLRVMRLCGDSYIPIWEIQESIADPRAFPIHLLISRATKVTLQRFSNSQLEL